MGDACSHHRRADHKITWGRPSRLYYNPVIWWLLERPRARVTAVAFHANSFSFQVSVFRPFALRASLRLLSIEGRAEISRPGALNPTPSCDTECTQGVVPVTNRAAWA